MLPLGTDSGPQSLTFCSFMLLDFLLSLAAPFLSLVLVYNDLPSDVTPLRHCSRLSSD